MRGTYTLSTEQRPVDVLVAGGGMAGVFAALAARAQGNRVLMLEPHNVLGGQGTAGGVAGFCGDTRRVNAPFAELIAELEARGAIAPYDPEADRRAYDLEHIAFCLQEFVVSRGIEVLLHSRAVDARADAGKVESVLAVTSSGFVEFRPRMVIDATGACAVARAAGFETFHEPENRQLPMSLYFTLWDTGKPVAPVLPAGCPQWAGDDDLPMTTLHRFPSGKVEVKMKVIGFDAADGASLSAAEIFARRQMMGLIYHLQTKGYLGRKLDSHVLASTSRQIGIREERRIVGEHILTEAEVSCATRFKDAVAVGTYHLDYHWPDKVQRAGTGITTSVAPYQIPLRALIPRGAANLLVPGRGASGDQMAMSSFRVMATCAQMGFAAGTAAAHCLKTNCLLPGIDVESLQRSIEAGGQSLNLANYGEYQASRLQKAHV